MTGQPRATSSVQGSQTLPFNGRVVWLTPDQGGRTSGPPATPADSDYAATAFVQPETIDSGLASFILRVDDRSAWSSRANGGWLAADNQWPHMVERGSIVVITEGPRVVAYFHVDEIA